MLTSSRMCSDIHLYRYLTHWIISGLTWNNIIRLAHLASQCIKRKRQWKKVSSIFCQKHLEISDIYFTFKRESVTDLGVILPQKYLSIANVYVKCLSKIKKKSFHLEPSILVVIRWVCILKCTSPCFLLASAPQKSYGKYAFGKLFLYCYWWIFCWGLCLSQLLKFCTSTVLGGCRDGRGTRNLILKVFTFEHQRRF